MSLGGRARYTGLWTSSVEESDMGAVTPKPSVDRAAVGRVLRQVMAHNKVVECEEMWAAHQIQRESNLPSELMGAPARVIKGEVELLPSHAVCPHAGAPPASGSRAATEAPGCRSNVSTEAIQEAREAAAQRKLQALKQVQEMEEAMVVSKQHAASGSSKEDEGRKRRKHERKEAKALRRAAKKAKKAARRAKRRRRGLSDSSGCSSSSGGV
eukprot:scaffold72298_cov28-Tisochrysis_lutea.AAC.2